MATWLPIASGQLTGGAIEEQFNASNPFLTQGQKVIAVVMARPKNAVTAVLLDELAENVGLRLRYFIKTLVVFKNLPDLAIQIPRNRQKASPSARFPNLPFLAKSHS